MADKQIRIELLTGKNYTSWKTIMTSVLMSKGLWPYVSTVPDLKLEENVLKNEEPKALIYTSMDSAQVNATGQCITAKELWLKVHENNEGTEHDVRNSALSDFLSIKYKKGEFSMI